MESWDSDGDERVAGPQGEEDCSLLQRSPESISYSTPTKNMAEMKKNGYPKGVFFIVGNEFCERFSYYGMRAILVLYLYSWLGFTKNNATAIYHFFIVLCYFSPLLGAIIADGFWGKYKTILLISMVYGLGNVLMALTALPPPHIAGPIIALILIGLGTGGIKPCVSAFGGDQFTADQEKQQTQFFSVFYFAINLGSLFSIVLTPLIREYVKCFGTNCFPLAFGIPAVLMIVAIVLFFLGRKMYKVYPPSGNVIGQMCKCIGRAIKNRCATKESRPHWLDHADDLYETKFIEEVKCVLRVFLMFLPLPIFWALFDQQGSRWILQATEMNLKVGSMRIPPDLLQALNPLFIIALIPLFESCCYPMFAKCNFLVKPLQRMVVGMLLAALAFVIAGVLQAKIDSSLRSPVPTGMSSVRCINSAPCPVQLLSDWKNKTIPTAQGSEPTILEPGSYDAHFSVSSSCAALSGDSETTLTATLR